jgi:hypothetical protein
MGKSTEDTESFPIKNKLVGEAFYDLIIVPDSMVRVPICHSIQTSIAVNCEVRIADSPVCGGEKVDS